MPRLIATEPAPASGAGTRRPREQARAVQFRSGAQIRLHGDALRFSRIAQGGLPPSGERVGAEALQRGPWIPLQYLLALLGRRRPRGPLAPSFLGPAMVERRSRSCGAPFIVDRMRLATWTEAVWARGRWRQRLVMANKPSDSPWDSVEIDDEEAPRRRVEPHHRVVDTRAAAPRQVPFEVSCARCPDER
jgi:hypothetical protein